MGLEQLLVIRTTIIGIPVIAIIRKEVAAEFYTMMIYLPAEFRIPMSRERLP